MLLSVKQVAEMVGISPKTVYNYIKNNKLPAFKWGVKLWRIKESDVQALLVKK